MFWTKAAMRREEGYIYRGKLGVRVGSVDISRMFLRFFLSTLFYVFVVVLVLVLAKIWRRLGKVGQDGTP
ncbi:hypothetical protein M0804_008120 [Polistes exclamans]|nr:hypothetical protein M0804_008120 [Polistes exclamans]